MSSSTAFGRLSRATEREDQRTPTRVFGPGTRRLGLGAVGVVAIGAGLLGLVVDGPDAYLLAWCLVGGVLLAATLVLALVARHRSVDVERRFWQLFAVATGMCLVVGALVVVKVALGLSVAFAVGLVLVVACSATYYRALVDLVRARSTVPTSALDLIESAMVVIAVCAFAPLLWGDRPVDAGGLWFALPAGAASIAVLAGVAWSLAIFRRVRGRIMPDEVLGLLIAIVCGINTIGQTAQGLTGFALPAAPLLVAQAACFGVVLVTPLYLATTSPLTYDTLPALEQVKARPLDSIAIAALAPLLLATVVRQAELGWAVWWFVGVALVLLVLATGRGKLAMRETRRLYREVEEAADARRLLLADVLRSADHDRHRVAAQLHQQATAVYLTVTASLREEDEPSPALSRLRDDLAHQADDLRGLVLAVRPLDTEAGAADLRSTIVAYAHNLYDDAVRPHVDVRVDDGLALDWTTEAIAMRILQEALRNVARHAAAEHVVVAVGATDAGGVALAVVDDGVGFDPKALLFESGNEYMRQVAAHLGGRVTIESTPGRGTVVRAELGGPAPVAGEPAPSTVDRWLPDRRQLDELLRRELGRADRNDEAVSVAVLGLAPASEGCSRGELDQAQGRLVEHLLARVRVQDVVAALDGEQLVLLLPRTTAEGAAQLVDEVHRDGPLVGTGVALSTGVAEARHDDDPARLLARAEAARRRAEPAGRRRLALVDAPRTDRP